MLQLTYDLNNLNESFGPPDTPQFTPRSANIDEQATTCKLSFDHRQIIIQERFVLEEDESQNEDFPVSLRMMNTPKISQPAKQMLTQADDDEEESRPSKAFIFKNLPTTAENILKNDLTKFESDDEKENEPEKPPQLSIIMEESLDKNIDRGENEGPTVVINEVDQSTYIQTSLSEPQDQDQRLQNQMTKVTISDILPQKESIASGKTEPCSLFWNVCKLQSEERSKRHRLKPSKFWIGQKVRYLKNHEIVIHQLKRVQEVFLQEDNCSQILGAQTSNYQNNTIKGEITMKPSSTVRTNQAGQRIILTVSRQYSFEFNDNQLSVLNGRGRHRLVLDHPKIQCIHNTSLEPCTIGIKIFSTI